MIRNVAREIAVHLSYELSFSELGVSELLDQRLSEEGFAALAEEDDIEPYEQQVISEQPSPTVVRNDATVYHIKKQRASALDPSNDPDANAYILLGELDRYTGIASREKKKVFIRDLL